MKTNVVVLLLSTGLAVVGLSVGSSQEKFPHQKDRRGTKEANDLRYEGIRRYEDVVVTQLVLRSATIQYPQAPPINLSHVTIGFFIDSTIQSQNIEILIRDKLDKSYYMVPARAKWARGFQNFRWSADVVNRLGISLQDLYADAHTARSGIVVPTLVYGGDKPTWTGKYEFVFAATAQIWLKYWIVDETGGEQDAGEFKNQPKNSDFSIYWDGSNFPPGVYTLRVRYSLFSEGSSEKDSDLFPFYHLGFAPP